MSPKRILLVEDDANARDVCVDLLRDQGHSVTAVDDGALALDEIARLRPDVILLDLIMPRAKLDGFAVLSRLAAGHGSNIPVIILSGLGDALGSEISPELSVPIAAIMPKPLCLDALILEIDRLGGSRSSA